MLCALRAQVQAPRRFMLLDPATLERLQLVLRRIANWHLLRVEAALL